VVYRGEAKRLSSGGCDIDAAVRQVIGGAVDSGEVIDLFSEEFLTRVTALEQKSLALETLRNC
jgi:type I restriction enzyme R subunit